jgi:hypothetical protein
VYELTLLPRAACVVDTEHDVAAAANEHTWYQVRAFLVPEPRIAFDESVIRTANAPAAAAAAGSVYFTADDVEVDERYMFQAAD